MKTLFAAVALSVVASAGLAASWKVDPAHTEVRAYYGHSGFSEQSVEFREFDGELTFTPGDFSTALADFSIPVASVDSGVAPFDASLKGESLFDAANHPNITFVSTGIEQTGDMTAKVTGDLTFKGATNEVVFDVNVFALGEHPVGQFFDEYKGEWLGFTAETTINRSDWGMDFLIPVGSDAVRIVISTEMKAQ